MTYSIMLDMKEVEQLVRNITQDGLLWGACELSYFFVYLCSYVSVAKLVPVAYGIMKLQISCVVEDEKVGTDFLEDSIMQLEDHVSVHIAFYVAMPTIVLLQVQSVDIVAFNKI